MTFMSVPGSCRAAPREAARTSRWTARAIIGSFFLWTSGIHVGIAVVDPSSYQHFADAAVVAWVERGWNEIFMASPRVWGLAVAAGELMLGLLLLRGGRAAKVGWLGVIGFTLALVLFGWGFLIWSAPALGVLVLLTRRDWPRLSTREPTSAPPV
ncbi:hypothetical protein [Lapillicoccus sp.]|uniref:hypothetical protein n=1 Tax=Lapillicoccus sp. TaxID=1909287 RepID=UPI003265A261